MTDLGITMNFRGLKEWKDATYALTAEVDRATKDALVEAAAEVEKQTKLHFANGSPGARSKRGVALSGGEPNVQTGNLRRSIRHTPVERWGELGWQTDVGPTAVYGRRVELGFHGSDSRGRRYNQGPHPYFEPGYREVESRLGVIFETHWGAVFAR